MPATNGPLDAPQPTRKKFNASDPFGSEMKQRPTLAADEHPSPSLAAGRPTTVAAGSAQPGLPILQISSHAPCSGLWLDQELPTTAAVDCLSVRQAQPRTSNPSDTDASNHSNTSHAAAGPAGWEPWALDASGSSAYSACPAEEDACSLLQAIYDDLVTDQPCDGVNQAPQFVTPATAGHTLLPERRYPDTLAQPDLPSLCILAPCSHPYLDSEPPVAAPYDLHHTMHGAKAASSSRLQPDSDLADLERRVDHTLSSLKHNRSAYKGQGIAAAFDKARALRAELKKAAAANQQLQCSFRIAHTRAQLAEQDLQWMQLGDGAGGSKPVPLAKHAQLLGPPDHARPASCQALVSVLELPPPSAWDEPWCARVRGLQTLDVLQLHRQFLQHCAIMLPKAELMRDATPAEQQLVELCGRYQAFTRQLQRLAPQPWRDSINYNLETMQPIQQHQLEANLQSEQVLQFFRDIMAKCWTESELQLFIQIRAHFRQLFVGLRQEEAHLQQQLQRLCNGGAHGTGFPFETSNSVEAALVARQLDANLQQQAAQRRNYVQTLHGTISAVSLCKMRLAAYPWASNGQITGILEP